MKQDNYTGGSYSVALGRLKTRRNTMAKSKLDIFMEVLREELENFRASKDSSILVSDDVDEDINDYYQPVVVQGNSRFDMAWGGRAA